MIEKVSFVLTSCGRKNLLKETMNSFFQQNTYPIEKYIIVDDSCDNEMAIFISEEFGKIFDKIIINKKKMSQIRSIDNAYSFIKTPYIFHCEDDWEFFRSGFIEDSFSVLKKDTKIITVWLRDLWDINNQLVEREIRETPDGVLFRKLITQPSGLWHGFTFNPGLRRLSDYKKIEPYSNIGHEVEISQEYKRLGYYGVILEKSAVQHTGERFHVADVKEVQKDNCLSIRALRKFRDITKQLFEKVNKIYGKEIQKSNCLSQRLIRKLKKMITNYL